MDAASNNSVEDIRAIREEVNFLPTKAKYRVYIIDEVHMLSTGAFNALLKTLEEPPEHVKFILATTEPQKLPATILSRCQRFDFKRISNENIIKRLTVVCERSGIEITKEAMNMIAVLSEGAMRDALSILERCIQDGENKIDEDKIRDLVGIPKITYIHNITKSLIEYDIDNLLQNVDKVLQEGKDVSNLLWEMIKYCKDVLVYKVTNKLELYNEEEIKEIKEIADKTSKEKLIDLVYKLSELENDLKWSTQKSIMFQAGMIRLCNKQAEETHNLEERIEKIEKYLKSGKGIAVQNTGMENLQSSGIQNTTPRMVAAASSNNSGNQIKNNIKQQTNKNLNNTKNIGTRKYSTKTEEFWPQIVNDLRQNGKIVLYTNLMNTKAKELNDMTIGIEFPNGMTAFGKTVLQKQENIREISNLVSIACGKEMQIKYIENSNQTHQMTSEENLQNLANESDIPFNIIE